MKKRTRKLKGGSNSIRFHYTKKNSRIKWTETLYPYGYQLIKEISKIPWESYKYDGESSILIGDDEDQTLKDINGSAILPTPAYIILGGACCEVLDHEYNKLVKLNDYVDPTSDIDILLSPPIFTATIDDEYRTVIYNNGYSKLIDHYTQWLFKQTVNMIKEFQKITTLPLEKTSKENTEETKNADLEEPVGKFLVTRIHRGDMIKIQVTTTVKFISDHILEFVLDSKYPPSTMFGKETPNKKSYTNIDDIFIEQPYTLLLGQLKGFSGRKKLYEELNNNSKNILSHKVLNHCGRILYLAKLLQALHKKKIETYVSISGLFYMIHKDIKVFRTNFCDIIHKDFFKTFIECFTDFPSYNSYVKQYKFII